MKRITLLALTSLIFLNSFAQNSKKEDIKTLMELTNINELSSQIAKQYLSMHKNNYDIPGLWDTLNVIVNEGIDTLMDSIIIIYDNAYTHKEIKRMISFYKSPTGKKMIEKLPLISELSMRAGENWGKANAEKIEERIRPLVEKYAPQKTTFDDFFDPNETYEYDTLQVISDVKQNNTKAQGSTGYNYFVNYDTNNWEHIPAESINPLADLAFINQTQEAYTMIMAEKGSITLQQLKAAALFNMSQAAQNIEIESESIKKVNGKEMLNLKISCDIQGDRYKYNNYYYSGNWGILQLIAFTRAQDYNKNEKAIEKMVSGLHVE